MKYIVAVYFSKACFEFKEPIPQEVLAGIPVPPLSAVSFHNIKRQWNPDFSKDFDCNVIIDDISSNFVYVSFSNNSWNNVTFSSQLKNPTFCR